MRRGYYIRSFKTPVFNNSEDEPPLLMYDHEWLITVPSSTMREVFLMWLLEIILLVASF
jgi:hypothetical protein